MVVVVVVERVCGLRMKQREFASGAERVATGRRVRVWCLSACEKAKSETRLVAGEGGQGGAERIAFLTTDTGWDV